jgi:hypothetical protein
MHYLQEKRNRINESPARTILYFARVRFTHLVSGIGYKGTGYNPLFLMPLYLFMLIKCGNSCLPPACPVGMAGKYPVCSIRKCGCIYITTIFIAFLWNFFENV